MKISLSVVLAVAGLSVAQLNLPNCALTCVTRFTSGSQIGSCEAQNIACICANANFLSGIACCLTEVCSIAEQEQATSEAIKFCRITGGVTGLPTAVSCATASPTGTGSPSTGSTASAAMTSGSTSAGSTPTSASVPSSITSSGTSTGSSAAAASTASTRNVGSQNVAGMGAGVLGAFMAILL